MPFATLYVHRPVLNGAEIADWFARQGFQTTLAPSDMHVTVAYSKQPLWWDPIPQAEPNVTVPSNSRTIERLGDKGAIVLRFDNQTLHRRWKEFRNYGAVWDYDGYRPHVSITYHGSDIDLSRIKPFPGEIKLGHEVFSELNSDWSDNVREFPSDETLSKAVVISLPAIVKARSVGSDGRRIVEVEASCEEVDADGDVILQKALLDSSDSFVATGHLDIDHKSEFGERMGIPNPASYIVGRPLEVKSAAGNRTFVVGEIRKAKDGVHDPLRNRYDDLWDSLQSDPPVSWYASVYGFPKPGMLDDCREGCVASDATRFLIKGLDWRSLAFTRNPKNTALRGAARIVTAKSWLADIIKSGVETPPSVMLPDSMEALWATRVCPSCSVHKAPSLLGYRRHFAKCGGIPLGAADIFAHALMHKSNMEAYGPPSVLPSGNAFLAQQIA